jgi:ATP-grasp domain
VRIVQDLRSAHETFADLIAFPRALTIGKKLLQDLNPDPFRARVGRRVPRVTTQRYVRGRPANRAVACWKGEVIAGLSVEALEWFEGIGPATVVRVIDHAEMAAAAARIVRALGLSGFVGFDFMLDESDHAWLIEMNARTTQICHLAFGEQTDMIGALYARIANLPQRKFTSAPHDAIALFPQELWRNSASPYFVSAYHDVPWDEPHLVSSYLKLPAKKWVDRLQERLRRASWRSDDAPRLSATLPPAADKQLS